MYVLNIGTSILWHLLNFEIAILNH
jgi:hypothetical protein